MKSLKQYSIPFTGLKLGQHQFDYEVDKSFFDEFEYSLVKDGKLKVNLLLEKQETMMLLDFHIKGEIVLNCDKCLADFPKTVETEERLIAKFTESDDLADSEEVMVITKNETEIDVSTFIYEMINLTVPYINVCEDPGNTPACDKEMLSKIAELSVENEEGTAQDPRWDALKNIRKN
ncbi:YceD family protein [Pelobium manganitolerans]|uniref:YceD family protein n=1 Tax=Pelobium manganitolerans TaxID=1842495 RepID=UPI003FA39CE5